MVVPDSTVVEQSTHDPKVKGLHPNTGTEMKENGQMFWY